MTLDDGLTEVANMRALLRTVEGALELASTADGFEALAAALSAAEGPLARALLKLRETQVDVDEESK